MSRTMIALALVSFLVTTAAPESFHKPPVDSCALPVGAAQTQAPVMRVEVNLQPIDVQVKDSKGNDVAGLLAKDFTVLENGERQKIAFFDAGKGPVSLVILVDSSSTVSSSGRLGSAQAIAAQFMRTARPGDHISAMDFTDQMGSFQRLTSAQLQNPSSLTLSPAPSSGSAIYEAVATALCHLRSSKNLRQAVIVISDGVDQYSHISLEQLIGLVRSSRAQLFMIGMQSQPEFGFQGHPEPRLTLITGSDIDNPVVVFDRLMKESGAESFIPKSQRGLDEALQAVQDMLNSEYTLAYYPQKSSSGLRKIEVKVNRRGARVLARRFVEPEQSASQFVHFDETTCTVSPKFNPYPYESKLVLSQSGVVYREDFSDVHSGWPIHDDSHYVSGGYELSNLTEQAGNVDQAVRSSAMGDSIPYEVAPAEKSLAFRQNVIAAYGPWWADFDASVTVKMTPATESRNARSQFFYAAHPAAGLVFRISPKGYYAALVSGVAKKKLSVELVRRDFLSAADQDYSETVLAPWTTVVQAETSGTDLNVESVGNQISVSVDGLAVATVRDGIYQQGWVGFVISGPGRALFKNLVVQQK